MTSFTRKLYNRDPGAAMAFYRHSKREMLNFATDSARALSAFASPIAAVRQGSAQPFGKRDVPPGSPRTVADVLGEGRKVTRLED